MNTDDLWGPRICIISLQRVLWLQHWDLTDLTYTVTPGACWSTLEPILGVVNACMPAMRPVLRKLFNRDVFSGSDPSHRQPPVHRRWLQPHTRSSSQHSSPSDRMAFWRPSDPRNPSVGLRSLKIHLADSDGSMVSVAAKPEGNNIQVTRSWSVDFTIEGDHKV